MKKTSLTHVHAGVGTREITVKVCASVYKNPFYKKSLGSDLPKNRNSLRIIPRLIFLQPSRILLPPIYNYFIVLICDYRINK